MNKSSQSSSLNVVVIMILCVVVLFFVSLFFMTKMSDSSKRVDDVSGEFNGDSEDFEEFRVFEDRTEVSIYVPYSDGPVDVSHRIPKSVIEELTYENRDEFIDSDMDYEILESDPLIAWHVERTPQTINYTIKKPVSDDEIENFEVEISKSKEEFSYVAYLFYLIILVIVVMVFKPLFVKVRKKKK